MIEVTAAELKVRYPEFSPVSDDLVSALIAEASPMVDEGWEVSDQKPGIMALAAHLLTMEGYPGRVASGTIDASNVGRPIASRSVGDVSVSYESSSSLPGQGSAFLQSLSSSVYGRRFAQLLKLNAPAIGLV